MDDTIFLPGGRDARGTLDVASGGDGVAGSDSVAGSDDGSGSGACVVACPPHPQRGGHRGDGRLRAVSAALGDGGTDCLRFDYGAWDGGRGEREDALRAVAWAGERYDRVGLFGYSAGGAIALSAAARGADVTAVAALAPPARLGAAREDGRPPTDDPVPGDAVGGIDTLNELASIPLSVPVGVFYGAHDGVATVALVAERARERGATVTTFDSGHFFAGREADVATAVATFLRPALYPDVSR